MASRSWAWILREILSPIRFSLAKASRCRAYILQKFAFGWPGDGKSVYVYRPAVPALVYRVELNTGHRQLWKELNPPDPAGINFIRTPHISADGKAYAYNYNRILFDLDPVDGLK
jgi:hypothetical protein